MAVAQKTPMSRLVNWARAKSLWIFPFGECACTAERTASIAAPGDLERWGARVFSGVPEQADVLLLGGRISLKMLPVLKETYERMPEPKWVVAFGGCACAAADQPARSPVQTGGFYDTYAQVQDIGRFVPVDASVPGCPPRIEDLIDAIEGLQRKISRNG